MQGASAAGGTSDGSKQPKGCGVRVEHEAYKNKRKTVLTHLVQAGEITEEKLMEWYMEHIEDAIESEEQLFF